MAARDEVKRWVGSSAVAVLLVAIGLVGYGLLTGPDDKRGGGDPLDPTSSAFSRPTPTVTATEPTDAPPTTYINAAPGEAPPVRPPDEMSDAGFEDFVRYFVQTIDWAAATMDPTLLDAASSAECGLCTSLIDATNNDRSAGRTYVGGRVTLVRLSVNPDLSTAGTQRNAGFWVDGTAYTIHAADGTVIRTDPPGSNDEYALNARFRDGQWSVTSVLFIRNEQ